mmetsp:Transcript_107/g.227  ORF Transcript_107/g.227 Transcript_107/m.227 type:complete len:478 (-) Transcript_107:164-1597(-)
MDNPLQEQLLVEDAAEPTTATAGGTSTFINLPPSNPVVGASYSNATAPNPSVPPPPVPHSTNMAMLNNSNGSNNNASNSMGNLVNESWASLSQLQWALLGLSVFYNVTTRLLVEFDLMHHHAHFSLKGDFHFVALLADLLRLVACGTVEAITVHRWTAAAPEQQQPQQQQDTVTTVAEYLLDLESSLRANLILNWKDALKPAVPVVLGELQGYFAMRAVEHLPITLAEVTFHGALLGIALGSTMFLDYSYTKQQWICLTGLMVGAIVLSTHQSIFIEGKDANNQFEKVAIGLGGLVGTIVASSLMVLSFERMLKQDLALQRADPPSASLWMRGMQYSLYSGLYNFVMGGYNGGELARSGWTWFFTPMMALGSVITLGVIKYVTSLHDRIAVEMTFVVSMLLNWWLFRFEMTATWMLYFGALIMLTSAYFFGCELPAAFRSRYQRIAMPAPGAEDEMGGVSLGMSTMTASGGVSEPAI